MWERWLRSLSCERCSWDAFVSAVPPSISYINMSFHRGAEWTWKMFRLFPAVVGSLGRGWTNFFLSYLHHLNYKGKKITRRVSDGRLSPTQECRYHNHSTGRTLPPFYQLRGVDSTNGISQNTLFLGSQLCAYLLLSLLKPVHWVHAVHMLSLLVLLLGTMNSQTQRPHKFTCAATSHIIPDIWKTQFLELIGLTFLKDYTAPGSALVIFKAHYKAQEKQET